MSKIDISVEPFYNDFMPSKLQPIIQGDRQDFAFSASMHSTAALALSATGRRLYPRKSVGKPSRDAETSAGVVADSRPCLLRTGTCSGLSAWRMSVSIHSLTSVVILRALYTSRRHACDKRCASAG